MLPVSWNLLVHVFVIIIIFETVHILVSSQISSAGSVNHEVRLRSLLQTLVIIPQLQLASVSHYQRLGISDVEKILFSIHLTNLNIISSESCCKQGKNSLAAISYLEEVFRPITLFLIIEHSTEIIPDLHICWYFKKNM